MGLSSFWAAIVGPRVKEITPHRPFSFEQTEQNVSIQQTLNYNLADAARSEVAINQPANTFQDKQAKRKSRTFTLPRQKSEGDLKKVKRRRSWFGGKPAADEEVPAVPSLPSFGPAVTGSGYFQSKDVPEDEPVRPGTALTTDEPISWSRPATPEVEQKKTRRLSLGNALKSRKRSQSSASTKKIERRQSVLGGLREVASPVPAVPAVPTSLDAAAKPQNTTSSPQETSFEKRKSRRMSLSRTLRRERTGSSASIKSSRSKRSSWWQSSNPDDDDPYHEYDAEELPPMPAVPPLIHDGAITPDPSLPNTSSPDNSDYIKSALFTDAPIRAVTRGTSIKQPRPVSGVSLTSKRRTYTPKSAANGFIKSTSGRASYRHSLLDDGENGMICLSDEQQREWDKLKNLMNVLEARQDNYASSLHSTAHSTENDDSGVMGMLRELENEEHKRDAAKYSNAQALAALEFHAS